MDCDKIADYRVKIVYKETNEASGVIVKLDEFPNHFFVFTAKHTFGEDIENDKVSILYDDNQIDFKLSISLSLDIVMSQKENFHLHQILTLSNHLSIDFPSTFDL